MAELLHRKSNPWLLVPISIEKLVGQMCKQRMDLALNLSQKKKVRESQKTK